MEGCADRSEGHVMTSRIKTLKGGKLHRRVLQATGGTESSRMLSGSRGRRRGKTNGLELVSRRLLYAVAVRMWSLHYLKQVLVTQIVICPFLRTPRLKFGLKRVSGS